MTTLQVRDSRAWDMAREIAEATGTTLTAAVLEALEARLATIHQQEAEKGKDGLQQRLANIVAAFNAEPATRAPVAFGKDEIDAMWGQ